MTTFLRTAANQLMLSTPRLTLNHRAALRVRQISSSTTMSQHSHEEEEKQDFKWRFSTYHEMEMMGYGHVYGTKRTGGIYRYNTKEPLKVEHVRKALEHFQRKLPNFRGFIRKRGEQLWACEATSCPLDFEVVEHKTAAEVANEFSNTSIGFEKVPCWKTRLVPLPDGTPCNLPEILASFPHQYDFVMAPHHSFIDGLTMAYTTQNLVELLNDVIAGKPIDDNKPFGDWVSYEEIEKMDGMIMEQLQKDPEKIKAISREIQACDTAPILLKAFPAPGGIPATKHISRDICPEVLAKFTQRCKENKVSFNAGFEAVINTALVEIVRDAGVDEETHQVSVSLATDLRRYMKSHKNPLKILGLFVRPTVHRIETHKNVRDDFWNYTKTLHQRLSILLKSGEALNQSVVRSLTEKKKISAEEYHAGNPPVLRDYGITNIGDLTAVIPGEGDHLQQTDLVMWTGVHKCLFMMLHQLYTFRGHSPYTISYDTSYMADTTAQDLIDRILSILEHFSQESGSKI